MSDTAQARDVTGLRYEAHDILQAAIDAGDGTYHTGTGGTGTISPFEHGRALNLILLGLIFEREQAHP